MLQKVHFGPAIKNCIIRIVIRAVVVTAANRLIWAVHEENERTSPPRGSNSQPSDHPPDKSLTLYPIELGGLSFLLLLMLITAVTAIEMMTTVIWFPHARAIAFHSSAIQIHTSRVMTVLRVHTVKILRLYREAWPSLEGKYRESKQGRSQNRPERG